MKAIYNRNCMLVGWYEPQSKDIFSRELSWIGFVENEYLFTPDARWIGGIINGSCVDKNGRPVAWIEGSAPMGVGILMKPIQPIIPLRPLTPMRPLTPLMPLRPLTPLGGWSSLEWNEYIKA